MSRHKGLKSRPSQIGSRPDQSENVKTKVKDTIQGEKKVEIAHKMIVKVKIKVKVKVKVKVKKVQPNSTDFVLQDLILSTDIMNQ